MKDVIMKVKIVFVFILKLKNRLLHCFSKNCSKVFLSAHWGLNHQKEYTVSQDIFLVTIICMSAPQRTMEISLPGMKVLFQQTYPSVSDFIQTISGMVTNLAF